MPAKRLLVVWCSRTGGARALADALIRGARDPEAGDIDVIVRRARDAAREHGQPVGRRLGQ